MPEVRPLQPGDPPQVGDHRLIGRLGEGGQGTVYLAESGSGRVAIKILHDRHATDARARERLLREVEVARTVPPFCTAQVLDVGLVGDRPYVVSEFIDGESLEQRVRTRGPLDPLSLERLAIGTATALAAIHNAGIVHRDLKPANVLLSPDGPRVVDFGIARALDIATSSVSVVGTPPYMSPEQFSGEGIGTASDIFSWGGTMIFAATGRLPFGEGAIAAIVNRVLHHEPDLSGLPEHLRPIVARCMAKAPEDRPTARDLLLELVTGQAPGRPAPIPEGELLETATARVRGLTPATPAQTAPASGGPGASAPAPDAASGAPPYGVPPTPPGAPAAAAPPGPPRAAPAPPAGTPGPAGAGQASPGAAPPAPPPGTPDARPFPVSPDGSAPGTDGRAGAAPYGGPPGTVPPGRSGPATDPSAARPSGTRRAFLIAAGLVLLPAAGAGATALGYRLLNPGGAAPEPSPGRSGSPQALTGSPSASAAPASTAGSPSPAPSEGTQVAGDLSPGPTSSATPAPSARPTGSLVLSGPAVLPHDTAVMSVAISPDGRTVVSGDWVGRIRLWDVETREVRRQINDRPGYVEGLAISPDGRLLLSVGARDGGGAYVRDLGTGKKIGRTVAGAIFAEFGPDGKSFVTGSGYEWARLWRTSDRGQIGAAMKHGILAKGAAFSPDGRVLAVASWDRTVRLWNAANARSMGTLKGHELEVNAVVFVGPRLLASVGYDQVVRFWDVGTRKPVGSVLKGPGSLLSSIAYHPGRDILAAGEDEGEVWFWHAATRRRLGSPLTVSGQIRRVLFSPDGRTLVVAAGDEVQLWTITYPDG